MSLDEEAKYVARSRMSATQKALDVLGVTDRRTLLVGIRRDNGDMAIYHPDGHIEIEHHDR